METYALSGSYPKRNIHTVEIDLQFDEFKGTLKYQVGGNNFGGGILSAALSSIEGGYYEPRDDMSKRYSILDEEGYLVGFVLYDDQGESIILDSFEPREMLHCVVGVRIVDRVPQQR